MFQRLIHVSGSIVGNKEFVYRVPIRSDSVARLASDSLHYASIVGREPISKEVADLLVRRRKGECEGGWLIDYVNAWLMPNKYTMAKSPLEICSFSLRRLRFFDEPVWPSEIVVTLKDALGR